MKKKPTTVTSYRIIKIDNKYIPETFQAGIWYGIDCQIKGLFKPQFSFYIWCSDDAKRKYCFVENVDKARWVIEKYKEDLKRKTMEIVEYV